MNQQDKPRENILWHYSLNSRRTKRSFEHFKILMAEAIKLSPCTVKFTSPDIEKLEAELKNSVRIEIVKDLLTKVLNSHTQEMEGYSYFGSNPGVPEDEYNEIADELIAELKAWQKMKDTE